jgi:hypothetical protein
MRKATLVTIAFLAISVGLTWLWGVSLRAHYAHFLAAVGPVIYGLVGLEDIPMYGTRERYINFVPFVSLVLVTPGIVPRRRILGLGLGLIAISIGHLVLNGTAVFAPGVALPIVSILISDSFPFFVWFVVAYPALVRFLPSGEQAS